MFSRRYRRPQATRGTYLTLEAYLERGREREEARATISSLSFY